MIPIYCIDLPDFMATGTMTCMKQLWCWRCKSEVPMLDEKEYAEFANLYGDAIQGVKELRKRSGVSLEDPSIHERFQPVRTLYERLTGMKDCHQNAIMHHRILLYGPHANVAKSHYERLRQSFAVAVYIQSKILTPRRPI
jgi:hypothetical protein